MGEGNSRDGSEFLYTVQQVDLFESFDLFLFYVHFFSSQQRFGDAFSI